MTFKKSEIMKTIGFNIFKGCFNLLEKIFETDIKIVNYALSLHLINYNKNLIIDSLNVIGNECNVCYEQPINSVLYMCGKSLHLTIHYIVTI